MKDGRPSITALAVAMGRGLGTRSDACDEPGSHLLPWRLGRVIRAAGRSEPLRWLGRLASLGLVDHVTLRMLAIDAAVTGAVSSGCTQLVVLGAGFDTRALRLQALSAVDVLEVDHPATQAAKRRRVGTCGWSAHSLRFVPVNFEIDSVDSCLEQAGHDPQRPTVWLWEAVTPYLQLAAIESTLATIGSRSAPGSVVAMTYAERAQVPAPAATGIGFSTMGEPILTTMTRSQAADSCVKIGFAPRTDTNTRDWARRYPGSARLASLFAAERLLVASRTLAE